MSAKSNRMRPWVWGVACHEYELDVWVLGDQDLHVVDVPLCVMPVDAAPRPQDDIDVGVGGQIQKVPRTGNPWGDPVAVDQVALAEIGHAARDSVIVEVESRRAVVRPFVGIAEVGKALERVQAADELAAVAGVVVGDVEICSRLGDRGPRHLVQICAGVVDEHLASRDRGPEKKDQHCNQQCVETNP